MTVAELKVPIRRLGDTLDFTVLEIDGGIAIQDILTALLTEILWIRVVPGQHVVHVFRALVAVHPRVKDDGCV